MAEIDKENVIDQEEVLHPKMVTVEIAGKKYQVPEGITIIKAFWYAGQDVVRGAGCLGGFCGACAAYYRTKDDPKVKTCLACQTAVQDGMSISMMAPFPARKATYSLSELADPKQDLFNLYPEAPLCRNCNACTEACPQGIDVRDGVVLQDPVADGDVPMAVRIGEQRQAIDVRQHQKDRESSHQRQRQSPGGAADVPVSAQR